MKRKIVVVIFLLVISMIFAERKNHTVYLTASGSKYHTATCRMIKKSNNVQAMDIAAAEEAGYTACKICNPQ